MAVSVEVTVLNHLLESLILTRFLSFLQYLKDDFGHYYFGVPVVLAVDVATFTGSISHALVVRVLERLNIFDKLSSLGQEFLHVLVQVNVGVLEVEFLLAGDFKFRVNSV